MRVRLVKALVAVGLSVQVLWNVADRCRSWQGYTADQWRLLLTADEELRIHAALGSVYRAYVAVREHVPEHAWLYVHEGLNQREYELLEQRPPVIAPDHFEIMFGTYRLTRVLSPMRVRTMARDAPMPPPTSPRQLREVYVLDRRPDLPLPEADLYAMVHAGDGFVIWRREG